jgi:hypothetical protein
MLDRDLAHLAPEMIPHSRAELFPPAFWADLAPFFRAGSYIFSSRARNDTFFPRRTVPRSIPGVFGTLFPRRRLHFLFPRQK